MRGLPVQSILCKIHKEWSDVCKFLPDLHVILVTIQAKGICKRFPEVISHAWRQSYWTWLILGWISRTYWNTETRKRKNYSLLLSSQRCQIQVSIRTNLLHKDHGTTLKLCRMTAQRQKYWTCLILVGISRAYRNTETRKRKNYSLLLSSQRSQIQVSIRFYLLYKDLGRTLKLCRMTAWGQKYWTWLALVGISRPCGITETRQR